MKTSSQTAHSQLVASTRVVKDSLLMVPKRFAPYSAEDVYHRFLIIAPDHKGQSSCAFGEYGIKVNLTIKVDFGKFICPILIIKPEASLSITHTDQVLLIIHRTVPKALAGSDNDLASSIKWSTNMPVCFMTFAGRKIGVNASLGTSLGYGSSISTQLDNFSPNPILDDLKVNFSNKQPAKGIATVGIGASITFNLSTALDFQFYTWEEKTPGYYATGMDSGLKKDFNNLLGPEDVSNVKREIIDWLKYLRDNPLKEIERRTSSFAQSYKLTNLLEKLKKLPSISRFNITRFGRKASTKETIDTLESLISGENDSLKTILDSLDLKKLPQIGGKDIDFQKEKESILTQLEWYKKKLHSAEAAVDSLKDISEFPPKIGAFALAPMYASLKLCFIDLTIMKASATVSDNLWLGTSLTVPKTGAVGPVNASGKIGISGDFRKVSSRFQTYSIDMKSGIPLIFTQDTNIRYTQAKIDRSIGFDLGFTNLFKKDKDWPNAFIKNSMAYNASSLYWLHPDSTESQVIKLQRGSGISFGFSVHFATLISIGKNLLSSPNSIDPLVADYISQFSKLLRIKEEDFKAFIHGLFEKDQQIITSKTEEYLIKNLYPQLVDYDTVLIESSLKIISSDFSVEYDEKQGVNSLMNLPKFASLSDPNFQASDLNSMGLTTESIRLRVRLKDNLKNADPKTFRLGFFQELATLAAKSIAGSFPFSLGVIKNAGNEGILDFYNHWILASAISDHRRLELAVPPVNLLPHHF